MKRKMAKILFENKKAEKTYLLPEFKQRAYRIVSKNGETLYRLASAAAIGKRAVSILRALDGSRSEEKPSNGYVRIADPFLALSRYCRKKNIQFSLAYAEMLNLSMANWVLESGGKRQALSLVRVVATQSGGITVSLNKRLTKLVLNAWAEMNRK